jgi:hypothetical protein
MNVLFNTKVCVCLRFTVISGTRQRSYQDTLVHRTLKMPTNSGSPVSLPLLTDDAKFGNTPGHHAEIRHYPD